MPRLPRPARRRRPAVARWSVALVLVVTGFVTASCGEDDALPSVTLSEAGERGEAIVRENGCTACHSDDGAERSGPTWRGLMGSEVELEGGGTVVADAAYVERSLTDPTAELTEGYDGVVMPAYELSDEELADVVAYLEDLSPEDGQG